MYIMPISGQTFEAKNFRLPTRYEVYDGVERKLKKMDKDKKYVREYSYSRAEEFYNKGEKTNNIVEKLKLFKQMGTYELKEMTFWERVKEYFVDIFKEV